MDGDGGVGQEKAAAKDGRSAEVRWMADWSFFTSFLELGGSVVDKRTEPSSFRLFLSPWTRKLIQKIHKSLS